MGFSQRLVAELSGFPRAGGDDHSSILPAHPGPRRDAGLDPQRPQRGPYTGRGARTSDDRRQEPATVFLSHYSRWGMDVVCVAICAEARVTALAERLRSEA